MVVLCVWKSVHLAPLLTGWLTSLYQVKKQRKHTVLLVWSRVVSTYAFVLTTRDTKSSSVSPHLKWEKMRTLTNGLDKETRWLFDVTLKYLIQGCEGKTICFGCMLPCISFAIIAVQPKHSPTCALSLAHKSAWQELLWGEMQIFIYLFMSLPHPQTWQVYDLYSRKQPGAIMVFWPHFWGAIMPSISIYSQNFSPRFEMPSWTLKTLGKPGLKDSPAPPVVAHISGIYSSTGKNKWKAFS